MPVLVFKPGRVPKAELMQRMADAEPRAIEKEFRALICGLELHGGCGVPGCGTCGSLAYVN